MPSPIPNPMIVELLEDGELSSRANRGAELSNSSPGLRSDNWKKGADSTPGLEVAGN